MERMKGKLWKFCFEEVFSGICYTIHLNICNFKVAHLSSLLVKQKKKTKYQKKSPVNCLKMFFTFQNSGVFLRCKSGGGGLISSRWSHQQKITKKQYPVVARLFCNWSHTNCHKKLNQLWYIKNHNENNNLIEFQNFFLTWL